MRERRHNRPIDIADGAVARARRDYDSSVPIILPPLLTTRSAPWAVGDPSAPPDVVVSGLDLASPSEVAIVEFKTNQTSLKQGDAIQFTYKLVVEAKEETLVIARGSIASISSFSEPQVNGAILNRWQIGYWCERSAAVSTPDRKLLLCETGKNTWVSFRVVSYSVDVLRDDGMVFIQAWGY